MTARKENSEYRSRTELERTLFPKEHASRELGEASPKEVGELLATRILKRAGRHLKKKALR